MKLENKNFDIVIVAGQSNAEGNGRSNLELYPGTIDRAYMLVDKNKVALHDPSENITPLLEVVMPVETVLEPYSERVFQNEYIGEFPTTFALDYVKNDLEDGRDLLIVKTAVGGTGFFKKHWGNGNILTERMFEMVDKALSLNENNKIVALLWHQGEHEAYESKVAGSTVEQIESKYENDLYSFFKLTRDRYSKFNFPIVTGDYAKLWGKDYKEEEDAVVRGMNKALLKLGNATMAVASDLESNVETNKEINDCIHFSRKSLYELGHRYYKCFKELNK